MSKDFYLSAQWLQLRHRVLEKARGCCDLCGAKGSAENPLQVDHIKPRSKHPELELVETNMQVLCRFCNIGKGNRSSSDWRLSASRELESKITRKAAVLASATPLQKAKLEQLSWLRSNDLDPQLKKEAERQYKALWAEMEASTP